MGEYLNVASRAAADRYRSLRERKPARAVAMRQTNAGVLAESGAASARCIVFESRVWRDASGAFSCTSALGRCWISSCSVRIRSSRAASARSFSIRACSNLVESARACSSCVRVSANLFTRGFEIGRRARRFRLEWLGALRNLTVDLAVIGRCSSLELRAKCRDSRRSTSRS
jgi:hypothetical protein